MLTKKNKLLGLAVSAAFTAITAGMANATTLPPALPDSATNQFLGEFVNAANGASQTPQTLTDNNLDSTYNSPNNSSYPINIAIFAQPGSPTPAGGTTPSGTFGLISLLRIWAQGGYNGYVNGQFNGYVIPPEEVAVRYGFIGSDQTNGYNINAANFANSATITAVNGVTPTPASSGSYWTGGSVGSGTYIALNYVSLMNAYTNTPTADNVGDQYLSYNVDLTVNIPSGANAVFFQFGYSSNSPNRSAGNGGELFNEIQAAYVPEPASLSLLALGGLGLTLLRRRSLRV